MGWSAGKFSRVHDWTDDESGGYKILSARMDEEDDNFAAGIDACRHLGGQNPATANLPMGGFIHTGVGNGTARTNYPSIGQIQDGSLVYATAGGTANELTLAVSPVITAYTAGQMFAFVASADNTDSATATMNINGVGAKAILHDGFSLKGGYIRSGSAYVIVYNGDYFDLLNPTSGSNDVCSAYLSSDVTISPSTETKISWDGTTYDKGTTNGFWVSGSPTRFTVPFRGVYMATANIAFTLASPDNGTYVRVRFKVNDSFGKYGWVEAAQNISDGLVWSANLTMPAQLLEADDYIEVSVYHKYTTAALDIDATYTSVSVLHV